MSELCYMSATDAIEAFRAGTLSPVELTKAVLEQADAVDGDVNALTHRFDEEALLAAEESEARYAGRAGDPRPLEGIPLALKDNISVAGQPNTQGSLLFAEVVAEADAPWVDRLRSAGAIFHARTATPEFCAAMWTHSKLWGVTRNPWNLDVAVGGSSGGAGAALASGTATLATGSDIGGSIRIPASLNGVVGFRPPYGRIPIEPPKNLDTYVSVGPMARTVADCALFLNASTGPHARDPVSLPDYATVPAQLGDVSRLRIAVSPGFLDFAVDPEIVTNTQRTAEALRGAGAQVDDVEIPVDADDLAGALGVHMQLQMTAGFDQLGDEFADVLNDYILEAAGTVGEFAGDLTPAQGFEKEASVHAAIASVHRDYDAIVLPTLPTRGMEAGNSYVGEPLVIDGTEVHSKLNWTFTQIFNVCSRLPVLAVPSGLAGNGVPTGVQIVGRPYDDLTVFEIGAALEDEAPWTDLATGPPGGLR